ncbi:uncharacterized protein KD926_010851 [Aspergillus affinis]|uniref:uncharacterized protein n=1 Tax=Aspergillus affinis TaxID=1070780 RepID=UPI0022FE64D4|nr:uncharacterized protein KD926_010851 [Aspergillus affinis]KAI9038315.1 hypothetical protein KD926_010851 [Aspergillus affinis]
MTKKTVEHHVLKHVDLHGNVFEVPTFTMKQIHNVIPAHCFRPSIARSMSYVVRDYLLLGSLYWMRSALGQDVDPHRISVAELTEDVPLVTLWRYLLFQLFGWPLYILDNLSGQKGASVFSTVRVFDLWTIFIFYGIPYL